jgi:hypothetical protein
LLAACFSLSFAHMGAGKSARKIPKVEVQLSGPTTVKPSESLETQNFKALLTNRSDVPLVFIVRSGHLMNSTWNWTVTGAKGEFVGMEFVPRGYCGTVLEPDPNSRFLHDDEIFVLGPRESHEFPIPGGPSNDYSFPTAGTYHLFATLTYVPPNANYYFDEHGKKAAASSYEQWDLSKLSLDNREAVQNSISVHVTSAPWNLVLPEKRPAYR